MLGVCHLKNWHNLNFFASLSLYCLGFHYLIKDYRAIIAPIALNINTRRSDSKVMTFRINGLGNKSVRFKGTTKINKITPGPVVIIPTASVTPSTTSVTEGSSVTFNITSNQPSTMLFWKLNPISGTVNSSDFSGGATSGSFTTNGSGAANISLTTLNEGTAEGSESFQFQVKTGSVDGTVIGTSATVTINDPVPTYSITPSSTSLTEAPGATCTFTVNTTNVDPGTTLFYSISGTNITSTDFTDNTLTGSYAISGTFASGTGSFAKTIQSDSTFEGDETFTATVRTSDGGTIVATSTVITIVDAVYAASFNGSSQALTVTNNGDFAHSAKSYTIEFFLNAPAIQSGRVFGLNSSNSSNDSLFQFIVEYAYNGSTATFKAQKGFAGSTIANSTTLPPTSKWAHIALSYDHSTTTLNTYIDGTRIDSSLNSTWGDLSNLTVANGFGNLCVGAGTTNGSTLTSPKNCSISNFRWVTGSALYTGASLTVPSVPLTAVTGTKVLLLNGKNSSVAVDTNTLLTPKTVANIGSVPKIAGP